MEPPDTTAFERAGMSVFSRSVRVVAVVLVAGGCLSAAARGNEVERPVQALGPLPPGAVEPQGWLRDWAVAARDGITGHLDEYHPTFGEGWKGKPIDAPGARPDGTGWPLEQSSYWLDGLVRLGYALHDDGLIRKARARLDLVVDGVLAGGESFLYWRPRAVAADPFNRWAHHHMGRALVAYYRASGDSRVLAALTRVYGGGFALPDLQFGGLNGVENLDPMLETYALGHDQRVRDAAELLQKRPAFQATLDRWARSEFTTQHGVCAIESARLPGLLFAWTRVRKDLDATLDAQAWIERQHMLPCGVFSSEEFLSGVGAFRCIETCNVSCYEWSNLWLLRTLGDRQYADRVERAFFNAGPAPIARDFKTACYYQSPNRLGPALPGDEPQISPGKGCFHFTRLAQPTVLCCVGNLNRIIPFYVTHMWMTTRDNGLAAALYGPCTVTAKVADGVPVKLTCTTAYPFEEEVRIRVVPDRPATFVLSFRVPGWCARPHVSVDGDDVTVAPGPDGFVRVQRRWKASDTVVLQFPMTVRVDRGRETPYPRLDYFVKERREAYAHVTMDNPYLCVSYGPLLFALPIPDTDPETVAPGARWNYALDGQAADIAVERRPMPAHWSWPLDAPLVLRAPVRAFDWKPTNAQPLPPAPVAGGAAATVGLVPYGCTKFRVSMFPVTVSAWGKP
jgi:hypothetical protein